MSILLILEVYLFIGLGLFLFCSLVLFTFSEVQNICNTHLRGRPINNIYLISWGVAFAIVFLWPIALFFFIQGFIEGFVEGLRK